MTKKVEKLKPKQRQKPAISIEVFQERKEKLMAEFATTEAQIQSVTSQLEKLNNNAQATGGAIQDVNYWITQLEADDGSNP